MRRNASWAFVGNSVYAGCQWAVFVLLVKSLHLEAVGTFAYALTVTAPVFVLANLRLRNLLATSTASPGGFSDYFTARLLTTAAAGIGSLTIAVAASSGPATFVVVAVMVAGRSFEAVSDICHGLFQREMDMRSAAMGLIANGVSSVALVGVALALGFSVTGATAAYAFGSCIAFVMWDLPRTRELASVRSGHSRDALYAAARLIRTAWPLGFSTALSSLQMYVPRYVVASVLGPAALAIFTGLAYVATIGNLVVNAVAQAALPILAADLRISAGRYKSRLLGLAGAGVAFGAVGVAAVAALGRPFLVAVYDVEYVDHVAVLFWLMVAAGITYAYLFLGTGSTARSRFGAQLAISIVGLAVVAVSVTPMVHRFGLAGAAWSLVCGAAVQLLAYGTLTVRDLRVLETHRPVSAVASQVVVGGVGS